MKLEEIGFYTLSDNRAKESSIESPMWRTEMLITNRCNFKCPYCRGTQKEYQGDIELDDAKYIIDLWNFDDLKNIRFSGGEPTLHPDLIDIVAYSKLCGIKRIAVSTNGYADLDYYEKLIDAGVNDFSISLDACCSNFGKEMCGGIDGAWEKVIQNIKDISKICYVTLGMVFTEDSIDDAVDVINFGHDLDVNDIRIVSSAQHNKIIKELSLIEKDILNCHPILKYRVNHYLNGGNVRGLKNTDNQKCPLMIDDSVVIANQHFPCIIYLREGGEPIGKVNSHMREERIRWAEKHDTFKDNICRKNCLDVCIDYNNKYREYHE